MDGNKNKQKIKEYLNQTIDFLKQKKVINIIIISLFLVILIVSCWIRFQNLPLLKDQTTGEYVPLALDPFYFLRLAETILEKGSLPAVDVMRYPSAQVGFSHEILPQAVIFLYKIGKIFNKNITIQFIDVISPVIFFILGLIVFFFLIYILTKSKITALISSVFLAFIPSYLYRSMAGFSDHEAIGMFALFSTFLMYTYALKFLNKKEKGKNCTLKVILFSLLIGFLSTFTIVSWGGGANFIFMILPLSFGLFWLIKIRNLNGNKKSLKNFVLFYSLWILSTVLFGLFYDVSLNFMINKVLLNTTSILSGAVLIFIVTDFSMLNLKLKEKFKFFKKEKIEKYHIFYSLLVLLILGGIFIWIFKGNPFHYIFGILEEVLNPFAGGRTGLTVAENRQPYLKDWINEISKYFFWLFYLGMILVGFDISKGINKKKNKILFSLVWIIMVSGILFSRISQDSLLNGTNFISKFLYFGSILLFLIYSLKTLKEEKIKIKPELIIISSWLFFMLISGRGAVRLLFFITPFACFMVGNSIVKVAEYFKKSRDDLTKTFLGFLLIAIIVLSLLSLNNFVRASKFQAQNTGPSANYQWQKAMAWVRENTPENSLFIHWWDYGYWVQTLGKRPTVTDGGHVVGYWDHIIGRYLLTTPKPETALSLMKTHNVSYLLIDPSDLGKYPAYSKIGSNDSWDRFSIINVMSVDRKQTQETSTGEIKVYTGISGVDEDIIWKENETIVFLPGPTYDKLGNPNYKSFVIGTIIEFSQIESKPTIKQPEVVFYYNDDKYKIPIRYLYYNKGLADFGSGLEAMIVLIPSLYTSQEKMQLDQTGVAIYLSKRTMNGLFAQLYLLNDAFDNYPTIKIAHSEDDVLIKNLKSQGAGIGDFVYYQGLRGPIKIWKVDYPENVIAREEFLKTSGEYAELDDLQFIK